MRIILLLVMIFLNGCATSYQPQSFSGGFDEVQLDKNVFRVTFTGNGYTRPERAADMALLRSADITLANGFTHFVIIEAKSDIQRSTTTTPTQSYTNVNASGYGYGNAQTTTYGGQTLHISKPSTSNNIMCFAGKPAIDGLVYDAQFICKSLGEKYKATCGKQN